ncbi:MAG: IS110 family transposase [Lachnospiraceae bacterium]|jgi:transposase|nr:IS110 family transposase [Lachnospiraceae bacterium]
MPFKILRKNCAGADVHKTWIYVCIGITDDKGRTEYHQQRFSSFTKGLNQMCDFLEKFKCDDIAMESAGDYWVPVFNVLESRNIHVCLAHPKYTKPQKGNKTDVKDAKWICDLYMCDMIRPSFVPSKDIRDLRKLCRYRTKLTNTITGEKNRALNCLTVSNLKLDDVFSDVFGKSSSSIIRYMLDHPNEKFDVTPFVDPRCKTPIEEIQAAVDGAISPAQAVKLQACMDHIDELEAHKKHIENAVIDLSEPYGDALELIRTIPGFDKNPFTAIYILAETGGDMSVFETSKHLSSWAGLCPKNDGSGGKIKSRRISKAGNYLKPLLVQVANALVNSKDHPEFVSRYRRIKARHGHKKAIIAICRMLVTAIWHVLFKIEPYTPDGYKKTLLEDRPSNKRKELTQSEALKLLKSHGYIIREDPVPTA